MNLLVLVAVVGFGIGLIVLLVHLTGGSRPTPIDDKGAARDRFAEDYPDDGVRHCVLSADGFDALLALEGGDVGLVHAVGSKALTRRYSHAEFAAMIELQDSRSILLRTGEMTLPPLTIRFADAEARAEAMAALGLSVVPVSKAA
ncbi:MAG: hypothetical protein ABL307_04385 [Roseitalea porphyridii]|uniref:hypothetical protein n=1 Tax=Roseitalea porphyridii TaxID=1852022 RepID=UPI0032D8C9A4